MMRYLLYVTLYMPFHRQYVFIEFQLKYHVVQLIVTYKYYSIKSEDNEQW